MKKMFRLFALILAICFVIPFAEGTTVIPADDDDLVIMLEECLQTLELDYSCVTLNRKQSIIVVDVAVDGLTENLLALKAEGFDETLKEWVQLKEYMQSFYSAIIGMFKTVHREDMRLIFNIVNDDAYIRQDYSTISHNPLLSFGIYGTVFIDEMAE